MAIQSIAAFGIVNQTTTIQDIGAFGITNQTVATGSPGATAGTGAAEALTGSLADSSGAGVAAALRGSLGACSGSGAALGKAGSKGVAAGAGDAEAVADAIEQAAICAITALGAINRVGTLQNIGLSGAQNESGAAGVDLTTQFAIAGDSAVVGLSGSLAVTAGAAVALSPVLKFRQAITAFGHRNVTRHREGIAAFAIINEAPFTDDGVAAATGSASVAALAGAVGVTAGAGNPLGVSPNTNAGNGSTTGAATCAALRGAVAVAAGTAALVAMEPDGDHFLSGSLGQCVGAGSGNLIGVNEGDHLAILVGGCSVLGEAGPVPGVGTISGTSALDGIAPESAVMSGNITGAASVAGFSGSLARASGSSIAQLLSPNGNEGLCVGIAICEAFQPPLGAAVGDAACEGLSGSLGEATGDCTLDGVNFANIGECVGSSEGEFHSLRGQGHEGGGHGGKKKKRRMTVVVDDQEFEVADVAEAEALIARAMELAKETAEKTVAAARKAPAPKIKVSADLGLKEKAKQAQDELQAIYKKKFDEARAQEERDAQDAIAAVEEYERQIINDILESIN